VESWYDALLLRPIAGVRRFINSYVIRGHSWQRAEPNSFLAPQINQFEGVLAIASELKRYVDVVGFAKSYFETANVTVARRVQVGNVHERKPDVFVVGAEGTGP
jgi:hypothetical protein